ncbi:bifunctional hydroxymethylpyrimidine kinase/phosphomethylpyrimidine kinase [Variovorax saccharolyticus]|uniref:bifunctional hydroxymethylpyrimidine kinase/phosphomethylpyrimidine kinase n=1 Tax=Variovorax saccharolyticus TaxID=3053516 RepID=UPI002576374E|nr:bifunctional hydroxymethylpyrimidine kinase/phosphomethylpyrimidine kinase [Variovorax sp. J31P216]MDM0027077.1 bifunctional hydroxymethylpyrimidine kinase/phosphomethylpyrimidine kinase [Variovorax sp. J31P216]
MIANVLSIAGTDPTGGAGIQADLKTFSALGAYGMSVITAVVAQNTCGVRNFVPLSPAFVGTQIDSVFDDVRVDVIKIGMVCNAAIAEVIADRLPQYARCPVILDPVMVAKSGDHLLNADAIDTIRNRLVPISTLITPNLPEAGVLLGRDVSQSMDGMYDALTPLSLLGAKWVLLKGGHLTDSNSIDLLHRNGRTFELRAKRVATKNVHGAGCTLPAAIAALLPHYPMIKSVSKAKSYLSGALQAADRLEVGRGHGPVHHFHAQWS